MPHSPCTPVVAMFALQVKFSGPSEPACIAGRLEHVLSGRCRDFSDATGLWAGLQAELTDAGTSHASPQTPTTGD